ncbi:GpE family phage tail protein [Neisseriaceae bacterium B1]
MTDMAWWFGWTLQYIDTLPLDDFDQLLNEITRQVKAGYQKRA